MHRAKIPRYHLFHAYKIYALLTLLRWSTAPLKVRFGGRLAGEYRIPSFEEPFSRGLFSLKRNSECVSSAS